MTARSHTRSMHKAKKKANRYAKKWWNQRLRPGSGQKFRLAAIRDAKEKEQMMRQFMNQDGSGGR